MIDFWNIARGSGRVLHDRVVSTFNDERGAGFEVELIHRSLQPTQIDILRETWKVTVRPTNDNYNCFDLESTQTNLTDSQLIIEKYHYGGFAVRGPMRWLEPEDSGWSDKLGWDMELPFFWAISESIDATLYQRYMDKRGFQEGAEFRYCIGDHSFGTLYGSYLDDTKRISEEDPGYPTRDWKDARKRWSYYLNHETKFSPGFYL